jgi:hypothetical protein
MTTLILVLAWWPNTAAAGDNVSQETRAHFEAGVALLQDPDGARYEDAYREFRAAYAQSQSPRVLGNIGFCAMKLERDLEAIDAYARYLEEVSEIDPVEREQIRRDLATLRAGVVRVTVTVDPPSAKIIDVRQPARGESINNVYVAESNGRVTIGLRPGHHVIRARLDDREAPPWELVASAGSTVEHAFFVPAQVVAPRPAPAPSRVAPIVVMAIGGAALAAGAVTGWLAFRRVDDISSACPDNECPASYDLEAAQRRAKVLTTTTDALLIGGGAIVLGGFTWFLLTGSKERSHASAACTGTGCVAGWEGRF